MWPYWNLSFYLRCDHANGRKHVPKQHLKDAKNLGYVGGYAAAYSHGSKQDAKDSYITAYETRKDANDNYITAYTKQDAKDGYVTQYGTKDASKNSRMEHEKHVSLWFLNLKFYIFLRVISRILQVLLYKSYKLMC